jgi:hypothetical protein
VRAARSALRLTRYEPLEHIEYAGPAVSEIVSHLGRQEACLHKRDSGSIALPLNVISTVVSTFARPSAIAVTV